jgi:hypothetical protein
VCTTIDVRRGGVKLRLALGAVVTALLVVGAARDAFAGEVILFTASTDNTGGTNPISVPNNNNPFIPAIDPTVTLTPNPALLDGNAVGPLNGITYGPTDGTGDTAGTTGFVTASYTLPATATYSLVWEVANVQGAPGQSALATDNVLLNKMPLFNFQAGGAGVLPVGLTGEGSKGGNPSYGTSGGVNGLMPSGGDAAFAWIDSTGGLNPIYDTVDGNSAARLYSAEFIGKAGMTLSIDAAFLTQDGGPFDDYGIIALESVPEPSSVVLLVAGLVVIAGCAQRRQRTRA